MLKKIPSFERSVKLVFIFEPDIENKNYRQKSVRRVYLRSLYDRHYSINGIYMDCATQLVTGGRELHGTSLRK